MLDGLIFGIPFGLIFGILYGVLDAGGISEPNLMAIEAFGQLFGLVGGFLYITLCHCSSYQATPGKRALGIKVVDLDGQRISFGRATGRYFATFLSSLTLMVGWLMAAFTRRRQALHDVVAGTLVVSREATPEEVRAGLNPPVLTGCLIWVAAALVVAFLISLFGILAAIAAPAYQDYKERAQAIDSANGYSWSGLASAEGELSVYNWSDYISENAIGDFEKATGIKVTYDMFDSNLVLETKLLAGETGYDIVVPTASFLERQIKAGVFLPLDKSKLPNLANMDPEIMALVAAHDPDNTYSVPYLWGTTGIGYNPEKVKKVLGTDTIDSWATIFEPGNAAKLAECGLVMLDAPTEVFDSALIYLGRDPNSESEKDLNAAKELLVKVRPHVRYFHSSNYIDDLAKGEICVALGWSGDVFQARDVGAEAETPVTVAYAIPKEGAIVWVDMLAIPADAKHPDNAHQFINYMMEPAVIAGITNYVAYPNANKASTRYVDREIREDPAIYPTRAVKSKLTVSLAESEVFTRLSARTWTDVMVGR